MVSMTTTWTTSREARWGNFTVVMFYNGQGFMVQEDRLAVYAA
jgi:ABC-type amino acid transport substrate-binding protein